MKSLSCTCGTGSKGTVGAEIEQRMADRLGLTVAEVHNLIDLATDVLDEVLGLPDDERVTGESDRRIAERAGISVGMVTGFMNTYERVMVEAEEEGLFPTPSDFLGKPRRVPKAQWTGLA